MSRAQVELNREIIALRDAAQLCELCAARRSDFNLVNCVSALQGLARNLPARDREQLPRGKRPRGPPPGVEATIQALEEDAGAHVRGKPDECQTRHLCTLLWSAAKLGEALGPRAGALQLADEVIACARGKNPAWFKAQEVSIIVWALGKLRCRTPECRKLVLALLERDQALEGAQGVANVLHGLGNIGREALQPIPKGLPARLASALVREVPACGAQELANALGGLARLGADLLPSSAQLWSALEAVLGRARPPRAQVQQLATVAWAVAKIVDSGAQPLPPSLLRALQRWMVAADGPTAARMGGQELSMCFWALGQLFDSASPEAAALQRWLEKPAESLAPSLDAQQLSTVALACARLGTSKLLPAIATRALDITATFNVQDLDALATALARLEFGNRRLTKALVKRAVDLLDGGQDAGWTPRNATNIVWATAKLKGAGGGASRELTRALLDGCSAYVVPRMAQLNGRDLSNLAWGLSVLGDHQDREVQQALADTAAASLDQFNAQELSKLLFALSKTGASCDALRAAAGQLQDQTFELSGLPQLSIQHIPAGGRDLQASREATGTTGATGGALWQDSEMLARWLAMAGQRGLPQQLRTFLGARASDWTSLRGKSAVELGAGLGLCSAAASCLGMNVVATDGDEQVLSLLCANLARNEGVCEGQGSLRAVELEWGAAHPLKLLGLHKKPRLILATGVVYGRDAAVWERLAHSIHRLSGSKTLVLMGHGNGAAPGVHHLKGAFYEAMRAKGFEVLQLPLSSAELGADFQGCQLHALLKRPRPDRKQSRPRASSSVKK